MNRFITSLTRSFLWILLLLPLLPKLTAAQSNDMVVDLRKIKSVVQHWNDVHNNSTTSEFQTLYAPTVLFYTQTLSRKTCVSSKTKMLRNSSFVQMLTSDITLTVYSSGIMKCEFDKSVTINGQTKSYPSYLLLQELNGVYEIRGESDAITDKTLGYVLDIGKKVSQRKLSILKSPSNKTSGNSRDWILTTIILLSVIAIVSIVTLGVFKKKSKPSPEEEVIAPSQIHTKQISEGIGAAFENYIVQKMSQSGFTLVDWKSDKHVGEIYPLANRNPDLEYTYKSGEFRRYFALECKYRSYPPSPGIHFIEERQLNNYREFQSKRKMKVYIVVGIGGMPDLPDYCYLIPLDEIKQALRNLTVYRKLGDAPFAYDHDTDRLT